MLSEEPSSAAGEPVNSVDGGASEGGGRAVGPGLRVGQKFAQDFGGLSRCWYLLEGFHPGEGECVTGVWMGNPDVSSRLNVWLRMLE